MEERWFSKGERKGGKRVVFQRRKKKMEERLFSRECKILMAWDSWVWATTNWSAQKRSCAGNRLACLHRRREHLVWARVGRLPAFQT